MEQKAVLLVENDQEIIDEFKNYFESKKIQLITAMKLQEARMKFSNQAFSFLIVSMDIEALDAKDFVLKTRQKGVGDKNLNMNIPTLLTSVSFEDYESQFMDIENTYFLNRPFSISEFDEKFTAISNHSKLQKAGARIVKEGDLLIIEGETNNSMYWIIKGSFSIVKKNSLDEYVDIGKASAGELIGEMSFLDKLPRSASVIALEDSEILEIPQQKFTALLDSQPRWFRALIQTLSSRLRETTAKLSDQ